MEQINRETMKQITINEVNGMREVRLFNPEQQWHCFHYIYATIISGMIGVIVADDYFPTGKGTHRVRALSSITCGNGYPSYKGESVLEVIDNLIRDGNKVYQFHTLREFVEWAAKNV